MGDSTNIVLRILEGGKPIVVISLLLAVLTFVVLPQIHPGITNENRYAIPIAIILAGFCVQIFITHQEKKSPANQPRDVVKATLIALLTAYAVREPHELEKNMLDALLIPSPGSPPLREIWDNVPITDIKPILEHFNKNLVPGYYKGRTFIEACADLHLLVYDNVLTRKQLLAGIESEMTPNGKFFAAARELQMKSGKKPPKVRQIPKPSDFSE
jgi:hypothetical protein